MRLCPVKVPQGDHDCIHIIRHVTVKYCILRVPGHLSSPQSGSSRPYEKSAHFLRLCQLLTYHCHVEPRHSVTAHTFTPAGVSFLRDVSRAAAQAQVCLYWNSASRAMWSEDHVSFGSPALELRVSLMSDSSGSSSVAVGTKELVVYST